MDEIVGDDGGVSAWQVEVYTLRAFLHRRPPGAIVIEIDRFQSHDFITDCSTKLDVWKAAVNLLDEPDRTLAKTSKDEHLPNDGDSGFLGEAEE